MKKIFKKIINFIKEEIIIRVFISFVILDIGVYLLINYFSKFSENLVAFLTIFVYTIFIVINKVYY